MLQMILKLCAAGAEESGEKFRLKVRKALQESANDEAAIEAVASLLRHYGKVLKKLDGSYEKERELKRLRSERGALRASRFVDDQAESGDEDEDEDVSGDEEVEDVEVET